jgi:preprotein translocase subunit SecG
VETLVWVVHVVTAVVLIGLVLMQHGKGADMGAAFGTGSAGSLFGSSGSANFLSRSTAVAATIFFITSLSLTYLYSHQSEKLGLMDKVNPAAIQVAPVAPGASSAVANPADDSKSKDIPK